MLANFLAAEVPEPCRVLDAELEPLALGHVLLLIRFESPYMTGAQVGSGDLLFALWVCSRPATDALREMRAGGHAEKWCAEKAAKLGVVTDWQPHFDLFREYLNDGMEEPRVWRDDNGGKSLGAPRLAVVKCWLQSRLGLSDAEMFNRPLRQTLYDFAVLQEIEGGPRLYSDDDVERSEAVAEYLKEHTNA